MSISAPVAIQPVERALVVLEALNRRRTCTIAGLARSTGLPRPTVARMLETLVALGYAARVSHRDGYRITDQVLRLSAGIRFVDRLVDTAIPPMEKFTRRTAWPLYLGTIVSGAVAIRYSTAPLSPLSFETTGYDQRFNVLASAIGRAILAFAEPSVRAAALQNISAVDGPHLAQLQRPDALDHDLFAIRNLGFAETLPPRPSRLHGIAVPILANGTAIAGLALRYPRGAMTREQAVRTHIRPLQAIARQIAATILRPAD